MAGAQNYTQLRAVSLQRFMESKGTKLSYTQFSKMEGMLGKIKLSFQIY